MASSINTTNIDGTFPVAGQDNSSQGFRDNFTNVKTNLGYAKTEIEDLQTKGIFKSALTGGSLDNDLGGNTIYNVELNRVVKTKNSAGTVTGTVTLNFQSGELSTLSTSGSVTLGFSNWPATGKYAELHVEIDVTNVTHTLTLPSAVSLGTSSIQGIASNVITFASTGKHLFRFSTDDNGTTITVTVLSGPQVAKGIPERVITTNTGAAGDTKGMVCRGKDGSTEYLYVCVANYDGSTAIWTRTTLTW
jgi:hypothetical protein